MKFLRVSSLLLLTIAMQIGAQQKPPQPGGGKDTKNGNCGILYGDKHVLTFCAPDGWVLDNRIMNDQGIYAAFYPHGSNWNDAKESGTIMYINVVLREANSTVESMMDADAKEAKQSAPQTVVKEGDPIKIGDHSVPVLRFVPGDFDRYVAVAYIGEEKVLVMFVISSKNEEIFKKDYPGFVKLVQSYIFLGSDVTIEHK
jgi:antitoxin (DNA-binding transcriptional repressor) of toxin-antitoxin stability system